MKLFFILISFFNLSAEILSKEEFIKNTVSYSNPVIEPFHDKVKIENKKWWECKVDLILKKYLNFPCGVFIEAGAYDGNTFSNTKIFLDGLACL